METLEELGRKYGTDKVQHGYLPWYDKLLSPIRDTPGAILEIGIDKGASLQMWRDYFPNKYVVGIDIEPKEVHNATCLVADQAQAESLERALLRFPPFQVIIDDGGHQMQDQQVSLGTLFPHLTSGGYYIIEDLQTSLWPSYNRFALVPTMAVLQSLSVNASRPRPTRIMPKQWMQLVAEHAELQFYFSFTCGFSITSCLRKK